jgi:hypothetical protein
MPTKRISKGMGFGVAAALLVSGALLQTYTGVLGDSADPFSKYSPESLGFAILLWIGVPILLLYILSLLILIAAWKSIALFTVESASRVRQFIERRTDGRVRRAAALLFAQAMCVAASYSICQVLSGGFDRGVNADGSAGVGAVITAVLSYRWWNGASQGVVVTVFIVALLINFLVLTGRTEILEPVLVVINWLSIFPLLCSWLPALIGVIAIQSQRIEERHVAIAFLVLAFMLIACSAASASVVYAARSLADA